jgi:hypothetical protein
MFSVITNIYNKKTKRPTLMELFTATRKLIFFLQLEIFNVYTTGDTAHIDTIFKFLPHARQHGCIDILHCCTFTFSMYCHFYNGPCLQAQIIVKKTFSVFPVAVSNSIKVGPLIFLL